MPTENFLEIRNLSKHFATRTKKQVLIAVNDVSLDFPKGKTLGLIGESGSGKSTIGRCILRLTEPTDGQVLCGEQDLARMKEKQFRKEWRPRMQMVFQDPFDSLNPRMNIRTLLLEPIRHAGTLNGRDPDKVVEELLCKVKLDPELATAYRHQLTPGQQQRVGIARAIATSPSFLVLDEPISLLDISVRAEIMRILYELQQKEGLTYLFISHDLSTVQDFCHYVAVMYLGRIVETGTVEQVFGHPTHPYSQALLQSVLYPDPKKRHQPLQLVGEIPSPIDTPSGCPLHTRCPRATQACRDTVQTFRDVGGGHMVACMEVTGEAGPTGGSHGTV